MANNGVKFEHQIVHHFRSSRATHAFSSEDPAANAAYMLKKEFPHARIVHRDEVSLKGLGREVKADFWIVLKNEQHIGISVKMAGPVQLSSAEGARTATIFEQVAESLDEPRRSRLRHLVEPISTLPRNMLAKKNRAKALSRKPHLVKGARDYDAWKANERPHLNAEVAEVFEDRQIREAIVEEMLTGRKQFAGTLGVAEYMLTPTYFTYIDKKYVQNIAERVKIDVRGKSRDGFSFGCVRFDSKI